MCLKVLVEIGLEVKALIVIAPLAAHRCFQRQHCDFASQTYRDDFRFDSQLVILLLLVPLLDALESFVETKAPLQPFYKARDVRNRKLLADVDCGHVVERIVAVMFGPVHYFEGHFVVVNLHFLAQKLCEVHHLVLALPIIRRVLDLVLLESAFFVVQPKSAEFRHLVRHGLAQLDAPKLDVDFGVLKHDFFRLFLEVEVMRRWKGVVMVHWSPLDQEWVKQGCHRKVRWVHQI